MIDWIFLVVYLGGVVFVLSLIVGLGRDVIARSAFDLKSRRDALVVLNLDSALPRQGELVAEKEDVVIEVARTMRAGEPDEMSGPRVAGQLQRIDDIDGRVMEMRARVEARREAIEEEYGELIEQRKRTMRAVIVWRAVTLILTVSALVSLAVGLL